MILWVISLYMFKSYIKTAWRSLLRYPGASFVKLAGLAIGMSCCMLILVYIQDELSYNRDFVGFDDIYRVNFVKHGDGEERVMAGVANSAGPAIAKDVSQVEAAGRLYNRSGILEVKESAKRFQEQRVFFADQGIFDVFGIKGGDLRAMNSVVLTKAMARKYFGSGNVIGRSMVYENGTVLRVTGVIDDLPANSDIRCDALISFETLYTVEPKGIADFLRSNWLYGPSDTYVRLKPGASRAAAEAMIEGLTKKYGDERVAKNYFFSLQPLRDVHLHASNVEGNPSTNSIAYIWVFSAIAVLILGIANINFINLSNAQSLTRIAEIGVRRVSGADARQLLLQWLGEGLLLSAFAFLVALALTVPGLGLLNAVTGKVLRPDVLFRGSVLLVFVALFLGSGLLAGLYPAVFITRLKLTALLKGRPGEGRASGKRVRQSLIVTQFVIAIGLVIGALVIQRQLTFLRNKPLGFDKEQVVVVPLFGRNPSPINSGVDGPLRARMNAFENDLRASSEIRGVTLSSVLPGDFFVSGLVIPEGHVETDNIFVPWASVDYDFVSTIGAPLVAGRDFSKAAGTDHLQAFIINESAVRTFGWKSAADAIGKTMVRGDSKDGKKGHVIGVIKDFNFGRLDRPQEPLILDVNVPRFTTFAIRVRPDRLPGTIAAIHGLWDKYFPERIFDYSFLDENISALYNAQENLSRLVRYFALIAIFVSCTGLFALAAFMAAQRTREMGIRKVLGASVVSLVLLLFRDFFRLVVLAILISIPLAWWVMNRWLHDFAYRIPLAWWIFALAGLLAIGIAFLTVGMQGLRASRVGPVKSLRNE